jgi:acyl-CoA thioesterase FadM
MQEDTVERFCHRTFIRYADADQQGVVFNAHYLSNS